MRRRGGAGQTLRGLNLTILAEWARAGDRCWRYGPDAAQHHPGLGRRYGLNLPSRKLSRQLTGAWGRFGQNGLFGTRLQRARPAATASPAPPGPRGADPMAAASRPAGPYLLAPLRSQADVAEHAAAAAAARPEPSNAPGPGSPAVRRRCGRAAGPGSEPGFALRRGLDLEAALS